MLAEYDSYAFEDNNVPVTYHFQCDAGPEFTEKGIIKIKGHTFDRIHYVPLFRTPKNCSSGSFQDSYILKTCLRNIRVDSAITNQKKIYDQVDQCLGNKGKFFHS